MLDFPITDLPTLWFFLRFRLQVLISDLSKSFRPDDQPPKDHHPMLNFLTALKLRLKALLDKFRAAK